MATRLTTSTPTEMRPSLRDHHGSFASPPLPRAFPSHPCLFLVVFLTSYHGVITKLFMINILLFCYLPSYLAILTSYFACS